ncbi:MAG TPA: CPBP family intramembrane glutamic endopeptidase [Terriglobales bacterium]
MAARSSLETVLGERWGSLKRFLRDLGIGVIFLGVAIVLGSILSQGIEHSSARVILPHTRTEMLLWIALSLTAGICEEALYRGYLQRQFIAMTRNIPAGILLSAALFGMAHSYQGAGQAMQIAVLGAMGGILAHWCKSVRPGMIAHILQDVLGGFAHQS